MNAFSRADGGLIGLRPHGDNLVPILQQAL